MTCVGGNPVLLAGGCNKLFNKRSVLARAAGTTYAQKTYATSGNTRRWTVFMMVKRASLADGWIFTDGSASNTTGIGIVGDRLTAHLANAGGAYAIFSSRLFRDPTAWLPFTWRVDTEQAVAADRNRLYFGLDQITSFYSANYPAVNFDTRLSTAIAHQFGRNTSVSPQYFDGYIALFYYVDGASLGPEAFLSVDPRSGIIKPKAWVGDVGKNGHLLDFVGDAGDLPATAAEGFKDRALLAASHVAANDWTPVNFAQSDFTKDTPTNFRASAGDYRGNYAVLNPLRLSANAVLSAGNLGLSTTGYDCRSFSTTPSPGRLCYFEVTPTSGAGQKHFGICNEKVVPGTVLPTADAWYVRTNDGYKVNSGVNTAYLPGAVANGTTIGCAFDPVSGKVWFRDAAGYPGGGNPDTGAAPAFTGMTGRAFFAVVEGQSSGLTATFTVNYGQRPFVYAAPSSAVPWCVAASAGTYKRTGTAIVQALDAGATVAATLAAKRPAWGAGYIDIFKRYDAAEGWRWCFGDDPGNYLDTTDAASGKLAMPALAGSYLGMSLRTGAAYGIATGEVAHVNGVATTIADGLGNARKAILLRRVDAGGNWPFYHPDLSAGKIMYANSSTSFETTASDISNVTASGFDIGAGMPSGTYRWIAMAETPGIIELGFYKGTISANGPVAHTRDGAGFFFSKLKDAIIGSAGWFTWSAALNSGNPASQSLLLEQTLGATARSVDINANGIKLRDTATDINSSGGVHVFVSINDRAFATGACAAQGTAR